MVGKRIKNPIELKVVVLFDGGLPTYHIDDVSVHYGVSCEHELEVRRGMPLEQNQEILNIIKDFIEEGLRQIDIQEEILEADSMMDYNSAPNNLTMQREG